MVETADGSYHAAPRYPDIRRRDHCHRIGVIAEAENPVATVVDRKIVNRGNVDHSCDSATVQRDHLNYPRRLPHHRSRGDGNVCGGAVRRNDEALGHAGQDHMRSGGFGGVVDDRELVVGGLRAAAAEDQGLGPVGREHHHSRSVAGGNRRCGRTHVRFSVDDIDARDQTAGGNAIRDQGAVLDTAGFCAAGGGGGGTAAQPHQAGGQHGKQQNQDSFQTWDSNLMRDNHLDARTKDYSKGRIFGCGVA